MVEMALNEVNILDVIPQRPPFVFVDRLISASESEVVTEFDVCGGRLFVVDGELQVSGVIENMAQTCAAGMGYLNAVSSPADGVRIGFLTALRNVNVSQLPKVGVTLKTSVSVLEFVMGMALVRAMVSADGRLLAEGELKIYITGI